MDFLHEEEDDDFNDLMGGAGDMAAAVRRKKSKLLRSIRRRISIAKPMGSGSALSQQIRSRGRRRHGRRRRGAADEEESDESSSDDESSSRDPRKSARRGTLRALLTRTRSGKKVNDQHHQDKVEKLNANTNALSNHHNDSSMRRRSFHISHGSLSRASASRTLRMSLLRKASQDSDDENKSKDDNNNEQNDVPSPLPRRGLGMIQEITINSNNNPSDEDKKKKSGKTSPARKKGSEDGTATTNNNDKNNSINKSRSRSHSPGGSSKKRSFGAIKDALSVGTSSRGNRKRGRRRRRKSDNSDDGLSVDSTPSVDSTDYSIENRKPLRRSQIQQQSRTGNKSNEAGQPVVFPFRRAVNDENGLEFEAKHPDYYYQKLPWIIKSWVYFLTIVVPFATCYFCFVGIFHSAALHQNRLLQKVAFSNMMFGGLGCTFVTRFRYSQALDDKGVYSIKTAATTRGRSSKNSLGRKRSRSRGAANSKNYSSMYGGRSNMRLPRTRRRTIPMGSVRALSPTRNMLPNLSGHNNNHRNFRSSSMGLGFSTRAPPSSSSMSDNTGTAAARSTAASSTLPNRRFLNKDAPIRHGNDKIGNSSLPKRRLGNRDMPVRPKNSQNSFNGGAIKSVWDVETMISSADKKDKPTKARPSMNKHASIMEIYEMHATDEKVALLQ